ncbi:tyrosine-protein phosphatase [Brevibacillus ruminantium]|uniref:Tyrosine-protein phosphatase n=1 Tax=Brevibacillus ruminantium TaxID=2950604 RepID=A0ABY4WD89_9BACL|nr:tyrosine-protein phosphatase [Brevibacillus ruminantium]USG64816.1 tyrosine-protein phosphatase [Brevibacillus ruminantium]
MTMTNRAIAFDGLYNFRDIGGLPTTDGRNMKTGILFRSDELSRLSAGDLGRLQTHQIKVICDLRTQTERKQKPDRVPAHTGIHQVSIPIHHESQEMSRLDFFKLLVSKSNDLNFEHIMKDFYHRMAFERTGQVKEIITLLAEQDHLPALIHCTGGKDRTGYLSALIQLLAGVPYQTVLDDYLFSNDLIQPRMQKIQRYIRWMSLFQISPERMKPLMEVRRDYLEDSLTAVLKEYGTVEDYLMKACGIEENYLLRLRHMLVE